MTTGSDYGGITLDTYNDHENALQLAVAPTGARLDAAIFNDAQGDAPGWPERKPFVKEWFPEAGYHVVLGVTHALQMEDPRAVVKAMADFLRRHSLDEGSNQ